MNGVIDLKKYKKTTCGVVTFLDVLGWKGIYSKEIHAIEKLIKIVENCRYYVENSEFSNKVTIKLFLISDTIVVLSYSNHLENGKDIRKGIQFVYHAKIATKLIEDGLKNNIMFRGATSYGSYSYSNENFVFMGEAIDEAAEWHEFANWCGVIATPSAQIAIENILSIQKNKSKDFYIHLVRKWIKYSKIPLKSRDVSLKYALNWKETITISKIRSILANNGPYNINIAAKYLNTLEFVTFMETQREDKEKYVAVDSIIKSVPDP